MTPTLSLPSVPVGPSQVAATHTCGDCGGCAAEPAAAPPVAVGGAIGLFLMPVAAAALGAWLGRGNAVVQLAAGVGGLAGGMGLAWAGYHLRSRRKENLP